MTELTGEMLLWNIGSYTGLALLALLTLAGMYAFFPALRRRWLPLPRLRPGSWTGHDVLLVFCVSMGLQSLILGILLQMGFFRPLIGIEPDMNLADKESVLYFDRCRLIASPLALASILAAIFGILFARSQSRPHHYGMTWARWPTNFALGLTAFVAATPIVFGIHLVISLLLPQCPYPLTILGEKHLEVWEWILFGFQVLVMAPLLEELIFRGIVQGWLRRSSLFGHCALLGLTLYEGASGVIFKDRDSETTIQDPSPLLFALLLAGGYCLGMLRLKQRFVLDQDAVRFWGVESGRLPTSDGHSETWEAVRLHDETRTREWRKANATLALYGSTMLWAVFHSSAWPAPVALLPMGLVLGWLAQRTQSLVAPITYHVMFNLMSLIALYAGKQ